MRDHLRYLLTVALLGALLLLPASAQAQQSAPRLACRIEPSSIALDQPALLLIELVDVQNVYGYELTITYDAGRVQVQDSDTGKEGINLQLGAFLSPDFVIFNTAENGTIQVALTQLAPATPQSGAGELARVVVQSRAEGFANFAFGDVTLSDANGRAIQVTTQDCLLEIGSAGQPTPTPTATPLATATATGTATEPSVAPTSTYTPWPTATGIPPSATPTPTSTATPGPTATDTPTPTPTVVIITTPTQPVQDNQQQSVLPTATPTAGADVAPTPLPPTAAAVAEKPTAGHGPAPAATPGVSSGQETASPSPTNASTLSASPGPPTATVVVESTQTPTTTPTRTPLAIAQVPRQSQPPVQVIAQPPGAQPAVDRRLLYQSLGWGALLATFVLAFVVWRLRKNQPD